MSSSQGLCPNAVSTSASSDFYLHVGGEIKFGSVEEEKKWAIKKKGKKKMWWSVHWLHGGWAFGFFVATAWQYYQQGFPMLWEVMKLES